jgi:hypothetical protein
MEESRKVAYSTLNFYPCKQTSLTLGCSFIHLSHEYFHEPLSLFVRRFSVVDGERRDERRIPGRQSELNLCNCLSVHRSFPLDSSLRTKPRAFRACLPIGRLRMTDRKERMNETPKPRQGLRHLSEPEMAGVMTGECRKPGPCWDAGGTKADNKGPPKNKRLTCIFYLRK